MSGRIFILLSTTISAEIV